MHGIIIIPVPTMNTVFIVLPVLTLLMFDLGLTLRPHDFGMVLRRPRAVAVALVGQILVLPPLAYVLATAFGFEGVLLMGIVLIACCPGGSSSNVFSMLAGGDVALSVVLTALSSLITLITLPLAMSLVASRTISLPVGNLLVQNLLLMFLPIVLGLVVRLKWPSAAGRCERVLSKLAFPALMLLAGIFFVQHRETIYANFSRLGLCVTLLILLAAVIASLMARATRLSSRERRTIVIEVGMQNAAQAIAVASSPFIFNNGAMAVPAIVYALMMNVVLLTYVGILRKHKSPNEQ